MPHALRQEQLPLGPLGHVRPLAPARAERLRCNPARFAVALHLPDGGRLRWKAAEHERGGLDAHGSVFEVLQEEIYAHVVALEAQRDICGRDSGKVVSFLGRLRGNPSSASGDGGEAGVVSVCVVGGGAVAHCCPA